MRSLSALSLLARATRPVLSRIHSLFAPRRRSIEGCIRASIEPLEPRQLLNAITLNGDDGPNAWYIRRSPSDSANVQVFNHSSPTGDPAYEGARRTLDSLVLNGGAGNDRITIDFSLGVPIRDEILTFNAGSGTDDSITFIGHSAFSATYNPTSFGSGTASIYRKSMSYSGVDSVSFQDLRSFSVLTSDPADRLTIDSPASGQTRIRSTDTGNPTIAPATFWGTNKATLDTSAGNGSGHDEIVLENTGLSSSATLIVSTGTAATGQNNTLTVNGGNTNFHAGWGTSGGRLDVTVNNSAVLNLAATQYISSLTLNDSSRVNLPMGRFKIAVLDSLAIPSTSATLDVGDNDLILHNGSVSTITSLIQRGRGSGNWQGTGITSSAAAAAPNLLSALGVINNRVSPIDGQTLVGTDIIVKFVYGGDANLDNIINFDDYFRINTGYLGGLSGWFNGDFNYSGVVNFDDYFIINNAFGYQGAYSPPPFTVTGGSSSPEGADYQLTLHADTLMSEGYWDESDPEYPVWIDPVYYDPISYWTIYWGDGEYETVPGDSSGTVTPTHAYADDSATANTINVYAKGSIVNYFVGTKSVTVSEVAPTLTVSGDDHAHEGQAYTLTLSASDPGDDVISSWQVDWGDGTAAETYPGDIEAVDHTFYSASTGIDVTATDADGTYTTEKTISYLPGSPSNLAATAVNGHEINLTWTDRCDVESGFDIEQSLTGTGDWTYAGSAAANATSVSLAGPFDPNTTYYFRVSAYTDEAELAPSAVVSAATGNWPAAPTDLTVAFSTTDEIYLYWTNNHTNATSLVLQKSLDGSTNWINLPLSQGIYTTSYDDTGLTEAALWYYRVYAANSAGASGYAQVTAATQPNAPTNLSATLTMDGQDDLVTLTWTDNSNGEDGFRIVRSDGYDANVEANVTTYTDPWPQSGATTTYTVVAFRGPTNSDNSNSHSVTTIAPPVAHGDDLSVVHDSNLIIEPWQLLGNDVDPGSLTLTLAPWISGLSSWPKKPEHGSLVLNNEGNLVYTPDSGYVGPDSFVYFASNAVRDSEEAGVYIDVTNACPIAYDVNIHGPHGQVLDPEHQGDEPGLRYGDSDLDGVIYTVLPDHGPSHGTLSFDAEDPSLFTYTPSDPEFVGYDRFLYTVSDGLATSNVASVTIELTGPGSVTDSPPRIVGSNSQFPAPLEIDANTQLVVSAESGLLSPGRAYDVDPGDTMTVTSLLDVYHPQHGTVTIDSGTGAFTYTPDADYVGQDWFSFAVTDGHLDAAGQLILSDTGTVFIDVQSTGKWRRDGWMETLQNTFEGHAWPAGSNDTADLAALITGNRDDWKILRDHGVKRKVAPGTEIDISSLLDVLDDRMRRNVVKATKNFKARFPGFVNGHWEPYWQQSPATQAEIDRFYSGANPLPAVDCKGAAYLVLAKGLIDSIKANEFDTIWGGAIPPLQATLIPIRYYNKSTDSVLLGDWGLFLNDRAYLHWHRDGPYESENVIYVGNHWFNRDFWGFNDGRNTPDGWKKLLIGAFNDNIPDNAQINDIPGWQAGRVQFIKIPVVAGELFDLRLSEIA